MKPICLSRLFVGLLSRSYSARATFRPRGYETFRRGMKFDPRACFVTFGCRPTRVSRGSLLRLPRTRYIVLPLLVIIPQFLKRERHAPRLPLLVFEKRGLDVDRDNEKVGTKFLLDARCTGLFDTSTNVVVELVSASSCTFYRRSFNIVCKFLSSFQT